MSDPMNPIEQLRKLLASIDPAVLAQALPANAAGNPPFNPLVSTITEDICTPAVDGVGSRMALYAYFDARYRIVKPLAPMTIKAYRDIIRTFSDWLGRTPTLYDVATRANDFLFARSKLVKVVTLKKYRGHLAAILALAVEDGLIAKMPKIAKFAPPDHVVVAYLPEELQKLIAATYALGIDGLYVRAAIWLVYDTGCRHRDVMSLQWSNLDEPAGVLTWIVGKTGRVQSAYVRPETVQAFHALRPKALPGDDRLIPFRRDRWAWMKIWRRLGDAAGVDTKRRGLQAIRRTGASLVAAAGKSATQYLGHAPSSLHLADKFYMDRRIARPNPVAPEPLTPAIAPADAHAPLTNAAPLLGLLAEFLEYFDDRLHRNVLTQTYNAAVDWFDRMPLERLGDILADSAHEYANLLHHDGFTNIQVGNILKLLSRFLGWLVEQRGAADPDVLECWKSTIRKEPWRPPTAHPARDETY